jgi:hypothetical protein
MAATKMPRCDPGPVTFVTRPRWQYCRKKQNPARSCHEAKTFVFFVPFVAEHFVALVADVAEFCSVMSLGTSYLSQTRKR